MLFYVDNLLLRKSRLELQLGHSVLKCLNGHRVYCKVSPGWQLLEQPGNWYHSYIFWDFRIWIM